MEIKFFSINLVEKKLINIKNTTLKIVKKGETRNITVEKINTERNE
tara:strand:- start:16 stop:153 length:138 start_codon:yes stop_codon:yes gene_type:complete